MARRSRQWVNFLNVNPINLFSTECVLHVDRINISLTYTLVITKSLICHS